ncbi:MAG: hypothetical protein SGCHY_002849, partial [Lobulomycetales sp.]
MPAGTLIHSICSDTELLGELLGPSSTDESTERSPAMLGKPLISQSSLYKHHISRNMLKSQDHSLSEQLARAAAGEQDTLGAKGEKEQGAKGEKELGDKEQDEEEGLEKEIDECLARLNARIAKLVGISKEAIVASGNHERIKIVHGLDEILQRLDANNQALLCYLENVRKLDA